MVISRTIRDYLAEAMTERVERDMRLAEGLYSAKLREVAGIADRLALDPQVRSGLAGAAAKAALDARIGNELAAPLSGGNHFVAILDGAGLVRAARMLPTEGGALDRRRAAIGARCRSSSGRFSRGKPALPRR